MTRTASKPRQVPALACAVLLACATGAWAQEVSVATLQNVPADMIEPAPGAQGATIDLGQSLSPPGSPGTGAGAATGAASRAASAARSSDTKAMRTRRPPATAASARAGIERAVFERQPIAVPLPVGRERLITLPAPAALHVPSDMARVARIEIIDRTIYATALVPFTPIRIVAELIDTGQQLPMDIVADKSTADAQAELEVFVVDPANPRAAKAGAAADDSSDAAPEQPAADSEPAAESEPVAEQPVAESEPVAAAAGEEHRAHRQEAAHREHAFPRQPGRPPLRERAPCARRLAEVQERARQARRDQHRRDQQPDRPADPFVHARRAGERDAQAQPAPQPEPGAAQRGEEDHRERGVHALHAPGPPPCAVHGLRGQPAWPRGMRRSRSATTRSPRRCRRR